MSNSIRQLSQKADDSYPHLAFTSVWSNCCISINDNRILGSPSPYHGLYLSFIVMIVFLLSQVCMYIKIKVHTCCVSKLVKFMWHYVINVAISSRWRFYVRPPDMYTYVLPSQININIHVYLFVVMYKRLLPAALQVEYVLCPVSPDYQDNHTFEWKRLNQNNLWPRPLLLFQIDIWDLYCVLQIKLVQTWPTIFSPMR